MRFPNMRRSHRVWQRNLDVFKSHYLATIVGNIGEPILYLFGIGIGLGAFVREIDGHPYIEFFAPGMLAASAMTAAAFECTFGSYTRMTEQKVYEGILATPIEIEDIVIGEILWGATKSFFSTFAMLLVMMAASIFTSYAQIPMILLNMFVLGVAFSALALAVSAVAWSYEFFNFFFTLFLTPLLLFSGIYFPTSMLPEWFSGIFLIFPTPHSVEINRFLFYGGDGPHLILSAFYLAFFIPVGTGIAISLTRRRLIPRH
ncbi:MAG: ABC transporter permease [Nitrospinota bacterium]|nr:ABC transporter permease [Nitrospinota bacterium]